MELIISDDAFFFPEYLALADKLGIQRHARDVEISLQDPDEPVLITQDYDCPGKGIRISIDTPPYQCLEVYQWPEFEAFCKRLYIPWEMHTISIIITLKLGHTVNIKQTYRAGKYEQ